MIFKYNHRTHFRKPFWVIVLTLLILVVFSTTIVAGNLDFAGNGIRNDGLASAENQTIENLVSFVFILSFLFVITFLLAIFYWKRNVVLKFESLQIKSELNQYMFNGQSQDLSLIQEEMKAQKILLNERQQKILDLMAFGFTNKQISDKLFISENTVKYHIKNIYHLLKVKDRKTLWLSQG
jgi:DNA-binding CsgD family transcriptional regulator